MVSGRDDKSGVLIVCPPRVQIHQMAACSYYKPDVVRDSEDPSRGFTGRLRCNLVTVAPVCLDVVTLHGGQTKKAM